MSITIHDTDVLICHWVGYRLQSITWRLDEGELCLKNGVRNLHADVLA